MYCNIVTFTHFVSSPRGWSAKYCDEYVCLSVCLSVRSHNTKTKRSTAPHYVLVACVRRLLLRWQRCDTLCISGFVDDIIVSHNGASCILLECDKHNNRDNRDSNKILFMDKDHATSTYRELRTAGSKYFINECLVTCSGFHLYWFLPVVQVSQHRQVVFSTRRRRPHALWRHLRAIFRQRPWLAGSYRGLHPPFTPHPTFYIYWPR